MNDLVKSLLEGLIDVNESTNRKIVGMFGGGFKPPTAGHLEVVKLALKENPELDELIILVGSGTRDSISQEESLAIWNMYKKYLPSKVTIMASPKDKPPIGAIYSYARKNPDEIIYFFVGAREGNEEDFQDIEKRTRSLRKLPYQNVKVKQIVTGGAVSGTKARKALLAQDKEAFIQYLPDIPEVDEIWDMLKDIVAERISFNSDFISQGDVEFVDDMADRKLAPIDVDLSGNHFFDRLNDPRNFPDISIEELEEFFDKLADEKEAFIEFLRKYKDVVVKDTESNLNIPFMKRANKAIAKTIMRKKNFMTSNQVLPLDEGTYDAEVTMISRMIINYFKDTLGEKVENNFEDAGELKGEPYDLEVYLVPNDFETLGPNPFIINAAGDEDGIAIQIDYQQPQFPDAYSELIPELKDAIRHELEHVAQYRFSKDAYPGDVDQEDLPLVDYLTLDYEIPAFVQGIYKNAKTRKISFSQALQNFLDERVDELTPDEEAKIKKIYLAYAKKNLPAAQIDENVDLKDFTYFETSQGSKYVRKNSTSQLRRIKSYHANTGGKDAGLHGWKQQSMFIDPKFEKEANSVQFLMGKGFKKIAVSKTQDGKIVLLIPKDNKWVPATWGDAYPNFTKNKPEYQTKPLAWEYSKEPTMGYHVVDFEIDSSRIIKDWHFGSPVSKIGPLSDEDAKLFKLTEADPKKGTGKKPKGSGRRLYTDEDPTDTVKVKFSTRQDIVDTLSKTSFKNKSHARQSQVINLIHQRVRAALSRTKDPKKKKRLQTAFNYIKKRKEASKAKTKRLQAQKKKKKANEIKGGFAKGNVGTRYRAIYKKGGKFYYDQDDALGQGIRQTFGPFKTKEAAKKKMQSFAPATNYRDITENVAPNHNQKSAPYGSGYKPLKEDLMPSILSLTQYMGSNGLNLKPYPKLKFIDDNKENAENILGRTAYYDPNQQLIALYTMGRHPKDILRSYAHELIHHHQNLNNTLDHSQTTNTNADSALDKIEREAYEQGNILFRNWEDSIKNEK